MSNKRQNKPKPKPEGRLFIASPTLDMLLASCDNIKQVAYNGGIEYSNFMKVCKLQTDLRISTYRKCANAFGKDMLIIHLPYGMIDTMVNAEVHLSNRCYIIKEKDLIRILSEICQLKTSKIPPFIELFLSSIQEKIGGDDLQKTLSSIASLLQKILEYYGNK